MPVHSRLCGFLVALYIHCQTTKTTNDKTRHTLHCTHARTEYLRTTASRYTAKRRARSMRMMFSTRRTWQTPRRRDCIAARLGIGLDGHHADLIRFDSSLHSYTHTYQNLRDWWKPIRGIIRAFIKRNFRKKGDFGVRRGSLSLIHEDILKHFQAQCGKGEDGRFTNQMLCFRGDSRTETTPGDGRR
jgi:hypothetical protein